MTKHGVLLSLAKDLHKIFTAFLNSTVGFIWILGEPHSREQALLQRRPTSRILIDGTL